MQSHQTQISGTGSMLMKITDDHKIALCNDLTVHMVPLPSVSPLEVNAVETQSHTSKTTQIITADSLFTLSQLQPTIAQIIHLKPMLINPHNQSTVIL